MNPLHEQYRPTTYADVIGQDKAISRLQAIAKRGIGGRAYWFAGQSGTGKTTLARILAAQIADPICIEEIDATDCTPARLRSIESAMSMYGMGKPGRAYIVNEAHGLRKDSIRQLLVLLERLPSHVIVCFTTTIDGEDSVFEESIDAAPLLSRCVRIALSRRDICKPFAMHLQAIAQREGLDGQPIERYERLLRRCGNNLREAMQEVEAGALVA